MWVCLQSKDKIKMWELYSHGYLNQRLDQAEKRYRIKVQWYGICGCYGNSSYLFIIDGVLYKKWDDGPTHSHLTLVVPKALFKTILEENHDAVLSGHLGFKKAFSRIRQNYTVYCYKMKDMVRNDVRACSVCGARKRPHKPPRAPLQNYQQGAPLDRIAMDILGPFPESDQGNRYILLIGDTFTKWIETYPIPDECSATIAHKFVHEFISRYGTPFEVHTDQGRSFDYSLFQNVCKILATHKTRTSSYHPQSNGFIERFNQTLVNMISAYVGKHASTGLGH